jgi:hypothetical protein
LTSFIFFHFLEHTMKFLSSLTKPRFFSPSKNQDAAAAPNTKADHRIQPNLDQPVDQPTGDWPTHAPDTKQTHTAEATKIEVLPPESNSWTDAFKSALTEATNQYIATYVRPVHVEDNSFIYQVHAVQVHHNHSASALVQLWATFPQSMSLVLAKVCMVRALGAKEQLDFSHFYGLSFKADETHLHGDLVHVLVRVGGAQAQLRFAFLGEWFQREIKAPTLPQKLQDPANQDLAQMVPAPAVMPPASKPKTTPQEDEGTPMPPNRKPSSGVDDADEGTPMPPRAGQAVVRPAAKLQLRFRGEECEVPLFEDEFPYTIGRHVGSSGFAVLRSQDMASAEVKKNATVYLPSAAHKGQTGPCYTSREHLRLHKPDVHAQELFIDDLAQQQGKVNVVFHEQGHRLGARSIYRMNGKSAWLNLGEGHAANVLQVKITSA